MESFINNAGVIIYATLLFTPPIAANSRGGVNRRVA